MGRILLADLNADGLPEIITAFLFEEKGMHDLASSYKKDNTASGAVLQKCGFEVAGEGTLFCLAQDKQIERWEVTTNRHIWEKVRKDW
ncbi:MAG: GNAT family N-acetyltransferase [Rhodobiaceae bacterium]|nr:GNAT family N-acetyltransferase [Rhodobiaceae bacterium]